MFSYQIIFLLSVFAISLSNPHWTCKNGECKPHTTEPEPLTKVTCQKVCREFLTIWPMPTKTFQTSWEMINISIGTKLMTNSNHTNLLDDMFYRFIRIVQAYNQNIKLQSNVELHPNSKIQFFIDSWNYSLPSYRLSEEYSLNVSTHIKQETSIVINAATIFGARHALESLSQVIFFNEITGHFVIPRELLIIDKPMYKIRGLMVDTARNYIKVTTIERLIEGMAVNKMNILHWHLTDTQSFPYVSTSLPQLSKRGAFSQREVYTSQDIQNIVKYAAIRGVRIVPEIDGPAHAGAGWDDPEFVVCFNKTPWYKYCKEPTCGQFNPTNPNLYHSLKKLYQDIIRDFNPELFHFGGDEVNFACWRTIPEISHWMQKFKQRLNNQGFMHLWQFYQNKVFEIFMKERNFNVSGIVWSSIMTDKVNLHFLSNANFIIHLYTSTSDGIIKNILENKYFVILSNYDAMYLDCTMDNWCNCYNSWMKIYENSPRRMLSQQNISKDYLPWVLGGEVALWTEHINDATAELKVWPRTAAFAERFWSEPRTSWKDAKGRLDIVKERLLKLGINVDKRTYR